VPESVEENSAELLDAAAGRSKRWVEKLIAERYPKDDVPAFRVRKLPQPSPPQTSSQPGTAQVEIPTGQEPVVDSPAVAAAVKAGCGQAEAATSGEATSPDHGQPAAQLSGRGVSTGTGVDGVQRCWTESREVDGGRRPESTGSSYIDSSRQELKPSSGDSAGHKAAAPARQQRHRIEPITPARYKVQFTAGAELVRKLRQAQELLRHQVPDGDPAAICELGLDLLIESLLKKRFAINTQKPAAKRRGATSHKPGRAAAGGGSQTSKDKGASSEADSVPSQSAPRQSAACSEHEATGQRGDATTSRASGGGTTQPASAAAGKRSRHIPAAVRGLVAERDGLQCTFVGPAENRCESRDVELHHLTPFAVADSTARSRSRCGAERTTPFRLSWTTAQSTSPVASVSGEREAPRGGPRTIALPEPRLTQSGERRPHR